MALLVPIAPDAPGWLMMTMDCPSGPSSSDATTRVTWSVEPPAAHGTMRLMGRVGLQPACARTMAGVVRRPRLAPSTVRRVVWTVMGVPFVS